MKKLLLCLALSAIPSSFGLRALACTNVIITPGASSDGSAMVSYAADSHWLYGELYFHPAARFKAGSKLDIREWDSNRPLGQIDQVRRTFQTVGNMNEKQLIIAETTWGGRMELMDSTGIMDYGSLIYVTLQRASTAREAIQTIVSLANAYGYPSEGETFSIADKDEAWIMDLIGKGPDNRGIVWVARRIPDGHICAHANQARITRFPLNDPETLYAPDVISFAREKGYFSGENGDFSFREAYCPLDFGTVRGCDARVWSAFNILCDGYFNGEPAAKWLDYAMGYDLSGELPLWVKPERKITPKDVADVMRDHFEGTPMDMTLDIGAGGNALPYRWRPMDFEWNGKTYCNERAIATQQTGFWFVAQARGWLPDVVGALQWFGCDDAATSYLTPVYCCIKRAPECLREGNGDLLHYSESQFWICNRVAQACYKMYDRMAPVVREAIDEYENRMMFTEVPRTDSLMMRHCGLDPGSESGVTVRHCGRSPRHCGLRSAISQRRIRRRLTRFTNEAATSQFEAWKALEELLLVKFIDGNVKAQNPDGSFTHSKWSEGIPEGLTQPGYSDVWKAAVAKEHGEVVEMK